MLLFHLYGELQGRSGSFIPAEPRYESLFRPILNGNCGVSLFFIISGFVLALPFARHFLAGAGAVSLRKYFMRRVTRLEPPYLLSILLFLGLYIVYTHQVTAELLRHAAASALYLHGIVYGTMSPVNPISWSLEVEIQFYIAAPLFMQLYRVRGAWPRRVIMAAIVVVIGFAQFFFVVNERATLSILFYAQFFIMGLLLADLYIVDGDRIRHSLIWDAAGIVGLYFTFEMTRTTAHTHIIMPWTMMLLCFGALRGRLLHAFFANPWIATIGGMCYSIYLMHLQMIAVLFKVTRHLIGAHLDFLANFAIQLLVTGLPVLLISLVFYLLIERPCMDPNWPSRFWHWISGRSGAEAKAFDSAGISA